MPEASTKRVAIEAGAASRSECRLPVPAESLIPHRLPMRLVDRLLSFGDRLGVAEATIPPDCPLVSPDGRLDPAALIELMAQAYAVVKGYDDRLHNKPVKEGFLVGIRQVRLLGRAFAGDHLQVRINTIKTFEGFAVAEGHVLRGAELIASGTLKLWVPEDGAGPK